MGWSNIGFLLRSNKWILFHDNSMFFSETAQPNKRNGQTLFDLAIFQISIALIVDLQIQIREIAIQTKPWTLAKVSYRREFCLGLEQVILTANQI